MADLSERPTEDNTRQQSGDPEQKDLVKQLIWNEILWKWYNQFSGDRHLAPLFFREDLVLEKLAELIAEQLAEARLSATIAKLTPEMQEKLTAWRDQQDQALLERQQANGGTRKRAYHGAIGGSLTFQSTPTTLGTTLEVVYCKGMPYEAVIDLTDYKDW